jgi:hypothetical protein
VLVSKRGPKADSALVTQLDAVYSNLPTIACRGLCQASCGPVVQGRSMTGQELLRLQDAGGEKRGKQRRAPLACPYLTAEDETGRCSVYEARPMICRLWGIVAEMPCPHGCEVEPGRLSDREARMAMAFVETIGGKIAPDPLYTHLARQMIGTGLDVKRRVTIRKATDDGK